MINIKSLKLILCILTVLQLSCFAQKQSLKTNEGIYSGIPWFDDKGNTVSAHGANIIKDNGLFYLFGESKSDSSNAFNGFSCYSSADLSHWKFEKMVLPVQDSGALGPNRVGERVKVLKCPKTGEYVMFMHVDNLTYKDQFIGYATSKTINGTYTFKGALLFNEMPIKKWDMGVFQDSDGNGYLITHSGNLFKLSEDYKSVTEQLVKDMTSQCEAPAIFKKNGVYFWIGSGLSSWERNDNYYFTSNSLKGPWIAQGNFAPKGTLTWNSQSSYVLTIAGTKDSIYLFMGDRWSFPHQKSSATYVWQPLLVNGTSLSLPDFKENWEINTKTGTWSIKNPISTIIDHSDILLIKYSGKWEHSKSTDTLSFSRSDALGSSFAVDFDGTQIGLKGMAGPNGGYAQLFLKNSKGKTVLSTMIDLYCKFPESSLKFLSPVLAKDQYTLTVTVMGAHGNWSNKKGTLFGSLGNFVSLDKIVIRQ